MQSLWQTLEKSGFKVSTDTRKDLSGSVFFALKGETFDANELVDEALRKGAAGVVTENRRFEGKDRVFVVENVLKTLQAQAARRREAFNFPILAIGGSNGKTTTRELTKSVLALKYRVFTTEGNLNNHIGLPLSIFLTPPDSQIAVFEIGANHPGEHLELLEILRPTHVLVTNSGLDHLEGFGSPEGVAKANGEIKEWAREHGREVIEKENLEIKIISSLPLTVSFEDSVYATNMVGDYNLENIIWALSVGAKFGVRAREGLEAISLYSPTLKRSQLVETKGMRLVLDCYNANPTSMRLAVESFSQSAPRPRGVILGDMLELGPFAAEEHAKIVSLLENSDFDAVILVGQDFKKAAGGKNLKHSWFADSLEAREWFKQQDFSGFTFLLKGSRGVKIERVAEGLTFISHRPNPPKAPSTI